MIYTVTFNPSLDYIVEVHDFRLGRTNRTAAELILPGGKGINVSIVLNNLGIENTAFYYSAGFVGEEITRRIRESGIRADAIPVKKGNSRINVKLKSMDGTEINGMGPDIQPEDVGALMQRLDLLQAGDTLVLAGSIPTSLPDSIYRDIMHRLSGRNIRIVVDAEKELLLNVLQFHPFLIKPNHHELSEIFGVELAAREEVVPYARKLQEQGAGNVLVSMAGEGAVLVAENGRTYMSAAPKGILVNGVGAGDSMVAGFLAGYCDAELQDMDGNSKERGIPETEGSAYGRGLSETGRLERAFHMGLAAGSASAFSELLATKEEIMRVYRTIS